MKLLKKSPLEGTATLLFTQTTRDNNFLLSCLHYFKETIHHCLQETVFCKLNSWLLRSIQPNQPITINPGCRIKGLKHPQRSAINKLDTCSAKFTNNRIPRTGCFPQKQQQYPTQEHDWARLIKVNATDKPVHDNMSLSAYTINNTLTGKSILYVGGRAALYPKCRRLISSLGGHLLIYRGSLSGNLNRLYTLLENADMIIFPIDCIDHNDYFAVKYYCKFSDKPYTLLDRSNLATFSKGVNRLIQLNCQHTFLFDGNNQAASFQHN